MTNKPFNPGFEQGKGISARRLQLMRDRRLTGIRGGRGILVREMDDGEGGIQALVETRRGLKGRGGNGNGEAVDVQYVMFEADGITSESTLNSWVKTDGFTSGILPSWVELTEDGIKFNQEGSYIVVVQFLARYIPGHTNNDVGDRIIIRARLGWGENDNNPGSGVELNSELFHQYVQSVGATNNATTTLYEKKLFNINENSVGDNNTLWVLLDLSGSAQDNDLEIDTYHLHSGFVQVYKIE